MADYTDEELAAFDNSHIVLSSEDWEKFNRLLDEPPKFNPKIAELFRRKSIFDSDERG